MFVTKAGLNPISAAEMDTTLVTKVKDAPDAHESTVRVAMEEAKHAKERLAVYRGTSDSGGDSGGDISGDGGAAGEEEGRGRSQGIQRPWKERLGVPGIARTETGDSVQIIGDVIG